ncbi:MAG: cytochrome c [Chloroflexi bacterium]|nr:cytochrome c [Chloroflexota bacterium]
MRLPHRTLAVGIAALVTLAIACTSGGSNSFPTAAPALTATPVPVVDDDHADDDHDGDEAHEAEAEPTLDAVQRGRAVFEQVGCAACHGEDGSGTVIAPGLPGHNELQVRRQVRGPIGVMPVFGQETLSPEALDDLVAYVESLTGADTHGHSTGVSVAEQSLAHHRMVLTAFEADNVAEATHHMEHLIGGILDGQHLALMQEALTVTQAGEVHDAQHMVEGMLSDVQPPDETFATLHFKLGLSGLRVGGTTEATHHLEHAAAVAEGDELEEINEILVLLAANEMDEAEEHLSALLGLMSMGVDEGHEADDHDADATHMEGDEHDADAVHMDGDEHAVDDHDADAVHMDGDEHAVDEHDADAMHMEGDEHATDEHADADAMPMDGDEHAVDDHDADAMHMDGDEHAEEVEPVA